MVLPCTRRFSGFLSPYGHRLSFPGCRAVQNGFAGCGRAAQSTGLCSASRPTPGRDLSGSGYRSRHRRNHSARATTHPGFFPDTPCPDRTTRAPNPAAATDRADRHCRLPYAARIHDPRLRAHHLTHQSVMAGHAGEPVETAVQSASAPPEPECSTGSCPDDRCPCTLRDGPPS